jgi:hypothetical protein
MNKLKFKIGDVLKTKSRNVNPKLIIITDAYGTYYNSFYQYKYIEEGSIKQSYSFAWTIERYYKKIKK